MIKNGQAGDVDDFVIVTTAGEVLSARDAAYIDTSDSKAYKCDADDLAKMDFAGFVQEGAILNAAVTLIPPGVRATGFSGLTVGAPYYLSTTAGAITTTKPTNVRLVGVARSATTIEIDKITERLVVFTSGGTWTKRPGLKWANIEVQGAGGAGSASNTGAGAGGGGGAYVKKLFYASQMGSTETITIGSAGLGSGNTSFGSLLTAGNGGNASGTSGGSGGTAAGGDINLNGQAGQSGVSGSDFFGAGNGGNSYMGRGGIRAFASVNTSTAYDGQAGFGYGGGGGGGIAATDGSPDGNGGAGTPGIIIVHEYY